MPRTPRHKSHYSVVVAAVALVACLPILSGCGKNGSAGQAQGGGPNGGPGGARAEAPVPVAVTVATLGDIASYYTATATLAAEKEAEILCRVSGVVQKLLCEEGDMVAEGAELLLIDNDEYRYRHEQAAAERADLESQMARLEKMREQDMVSAEEYETLSTRLAAAVATEGLAALNLSYTRVTAPFSGKVVMRHANVGQNVNLGTPLFVLSDFTPLLARVHVPAREFNQLEPDQPVDLVLESNRTRLRGRIKLVSPTIDPATGTIKITIEIPVYPPGVRPGDFAQVSIVTERRSNRTLVPKVALVNDRGEQVVYVSADSTAERRVVEIGFQDDNNAEIVDGVAAGERIVVKGQRTLKNGSAIKILDDAEAAQTSDSARTRTGS